MDLLLFYLIYPIANVYAILLLVEIEVMYCLKSISDNIYLKTTPILSLLNILSVFTSISDITTFFSMEH